MNIKLIAKIYNDGVCLGFRENKKFEFYLKKYNGKHYILCFEKNINGDKIQGILAEDDFLIDVEKLFKIFNDIES